MLLTFCAVRDCFSSIKKKKKENPCKVTTYHKQLSTKIYLDTYLHIYLYLKGKTPLHFAAQKMLPIFCALRNLRNKKILCQYIRYFLQTYTMITIEFSLDIRNFKNQILKFKLRKKHKNINFIVQ